MPLKFVFAFTGPRRLKDDPSGSLLPLGLLSMAAVLTRAGHKATVAHLARFSRRDAGTRSEGMDRRFRNDLFRDVGSFQLR